MDSIDIQYNSKLRSTIQMEVSEQSFPAIQLIKEVMFGISGKRELVVEGGLM